MSLVHLCILVVLTALLGMMVYSVYSPVDAPLPAELSDPPGTMKAHADARMFAARTWGNASVDGPDRCMPEHCFWRDGVLVCRGHLS